MEFTTVIIGATVGPLNFYFGWERDTGAEYSWVGCTLCGWHSTRFLVTEERSEANGEQGAVEIHRHLETFHPRVFTTTVAQAIQYIQESFPGGSGSEKPN